LLSNRETRELRFYEAKDYSNRELWPKKSGKHDVCRQIRRYEKRVKENIGILGEYKKCIKDFNNLFNVKLPMHRKLDPKVALLVFGFNLKQRRRLELLVEEGGLAGMKHYFIGDVKKIEIEKLWNDLKCG
jgi:hypothetical protein